MEQLKRRASQAIYLASKKRSRALDKVSTFPGPKLNVYLATKISKKNNENYNRLLLDRTHTEAGDNEANTKKNNEIIFKL